MYKISRQTLLKALMLLKFHHKRAYGEKHLLQYLNSVLPFLNQTTTYSLGCFLIYKSICVKRFRNDFGFFNIISFKEKNFSNFSKK